MRPPLPHCQLLTNSTLKDANPEARLALVGGGPHLDEYRRIFDGYNVNFVGPLTGDELSQRYVCIYEDDNDNAG